MSNQPVQIPSDRSPVDLPPGAPVIGREREHASLRAVLETAIAGQGQVVLLGGNAGMGKTTLARAIADEAAARRLPVLAGHCYDRTNAPPYGPWLELFERDALDQRGSPLPEPPIGFAGGRLAGISDQATLFWDVRRFFTALAAAGPALILLEDLHWADPASVELLRYLAVYARQWPALLLATYRLDEASASHPFFQQLPALIRESGALRLDLKGLEPRALGEIVKARYRLAEPDMAKLVAYLDRHADGNPFFAVELLRALEEEGLLRRGTDRSLLGELARVVVPRLLRQVIDQRVARLGDETRQALTIAAVIGQEAPLPLWATIAGLDEEALLAIVERAVRAHLMEAERDGIRVRFVHALTQEALYEGSLPPRRRIWHRRAGELLAAEADPDPEAVALHLQAAGHPEAWRWLERAGQRAHRAYAWITAAERFGAAAELLREIEGEEAHYAQLIFRMTLLRRLSDASRTIAGLEEVEALAERLGDPVGAAEAQFHRGIHLCYADRFAEGLRAMENSLERLEALPLDAARAHQAIEFWFAGIASSSPAIDLSRNEVVAARLNAAGFDFRRCVHLWKSGMAGDSLANVLETSERFNALLADEPVTAGGVRFAAAWTHLATAIALAALGRSDEARPHWTGSHALFNAVNHFALIAFALLTELRDVALTYGAANPDHRRRLAADAETALARAGGALRPGISPRLGWLGCWLLDGRWAAADEALRDAPPPGNAYLRREVTVTTALLARHRDEPDTAWAQIGLALPHGPATAPGDGIHQEGLLLQRLAAELCLDAGDLATARSWLESHDRWLAWSGSMLGRADGELGWAGWLRAAGDHARARARAVAALELAAAPAQPLTQLAGRRLLGELAAGAGDMPDGERHFAAALDLADACEAPFERALTLVSLAEARQAAGASGVEALIDEARAIATPLRANRLLSRLDAIGSERTARAAVASSPEGLTRREIEVLRLLAEHRTDKEIAEALFISPHTASTHVKHLLAKLGVASRREAPARAARLIPPEPTT